MSWHTSSWPGQLAKAASAVEAEQMEALVRFREDWSFFCDACGLAGGSRFFAKITQKSPFQQ
eukprot:8879038-Lingulodinium_polyedra.AAC.1